jgi:hypothetical protein
VCVMREGKRLGPAWRLPDVQRHARQQLAQLPERYHRLKDAQTYPVEFSDDLKWLQEKERDRHTRSRRS